MSQEARVYLNGRLVPKSEARIDPDDRGFLFGDGIYEVLGVRDGQPLFIDQHFARLQHSTAGCELTEAFDRAGFEGMARELIAANAIKDGLVYLEVTRGAAPRNHAFPPAGTPPTVYAFAKEVAVDTALHEHGVAVVVLPDERWGRVDMKTVNLLPNVLANERAHRAGAHEAILVRDGIVTEGSHSNAWIVKDGVALTHPTGQRILAGITRATVLLSARRDGIACAERAFSEGDLRSADEVFMTGTTTGVLPVVTLDGQAVGSGRPGPMARALGESYHRTVDEELRRARAAAAL
jgi:D-alanine transaminase